MVTPVYQDTEWKARLWSPPPTAGQRLCLESLFPSADSWGVWETSSADSVGLCLWVGGVKIHCTWRVYASSHRETHSSFLQSLVNAFVFVDFYSLGFILKCGVSQPQRTPASSALSVRWRTDVVPISIPEAAFQEADEAPQGLDRTMAMHVRHSSRWHSETEVGLSTGQTEIQPSTPS